MADHEIPDVLADRYASPAMAAIWSSRGKVLLEREFWIAIMRAQRELGIDIPAEAIAAYEAVREQIDLESIRRRERVTRHDVKARIDEFCALAGHQHIHKGLTSRDLTENVEQLQVRRSLELVRLKHAAALHRLSARVEEYRSLVLTARTHNVPAQLTTFGKRLAMFGTAMLCAHRRLEDLIARYPLRGVKGPVGTQADLLSLFDGDRNKVTALDARVREHFGFRDTLGAVGQVYPRTLDFAVLSVLHELAGGPSSFAKTLRLMAGLDLASEGFRADQVGSSAMPHKMNSRSSERINGFAVILGGFLDMVAGLAGDQWNEGDVSCSVVRRVALPGAMFAIDGLLETLLTVLGEMEVFKTMVESETARYRPYLMTTLVLMAAIKKGAGREIAHQAIREHALAVTRDLRAGRIERNDLLERLASDGRIGLSREDIDAVLAAEEPLIGMAVVQADQFVQEARALAATVAGASDYRPEEIL